MPKAAIDENGHPRGPEYEIWPSREPLMPAPTGDSCLSEHSGEPKFGLLIASPLDCGHHARPVRGREDIGHQAI